MGKYLNLIVYFLLLLNVELFATQSDSLTSVEKDINRLLKKSEKFLNNNLDSVYTYSNLAFHQSQKNNFKKGLMLSSYYLGWYFSFLGNVDSTEKYIEICQQIAQEKQNTGLLQNSYNLLGIAYDYAGKYEKALPKYIESLNLARKNGDSTGILTSYINVAGLFSSIHNYKKEVNFELKALNLARMLGDSINIAYILNNLGENFREIGKHNKAEEYYLKSEKILKNTNDNYAYSIVLLNLAENSFKMNKLNVALDYINHAISVANNNLGYSFYVDCLLDKAEILENLKRYDEAEKILAKIKKTKGHALGNDKLAKREFLHAEIDFGQKEIENSLRRLKKILKFEVNEKSLPYLVKSSKLLEKIYEKRGDYSTALFYYKKYKSLDDSLNSFKATKAKIDFENMQKIYLAEKKIRFLKRTEKFMQLELDKKRLQQEFFLVFTLLIIFSLLLIGYYSRKIKIKNKELQKLNKTKEQMLKIFSHDLKNSLGATINFATLLVSEYENLEPDEIKTIVNQINHSANASNALMINLLNWVLLSTDELPFNLKNENLCEIIDQSVETIKPLLLSKKLSLDVSCKEEIIVNVDRNSISLVLRNLVTNAIKFSREEGKIEIKAEVENGKAKVAVIDNGVGMSSEQVRKLLAENGNSTLLGTNKETGTGLGLNLVKTFIKKNNGEFSIESMEGKGSSFAFTLPLVES